MQCHCNLISYLADYPKYAIAHAHSLEDSELNSKTKTPVTKNRVPIIFFKR